MNHVERFDPAAAGIAVPGTADEGAGSSVLAADLGRKRLPVRRQLAEHPGLQGAFGHDVRAGCQGAALPARDLLNGEARA
ncbi:MULTISPECIES: hypothetical protein [Kitasatospora]|uniref:Uncharacterized protein n=1 Tax=Kitasatospora cystarginea TaxID=58350 RepID=A0ABP5R4A7_9ACTN